VHLLLVSEVLCGGEGETGSNNTLNASVISKVQEKDDTIHGAVNLEVGLEETSSLLIDTHSGEDNGEVLLGVIVDIFVLNKGSLATNLGTNFVMRKTGSREEGNLLATGNGVHDIDGRDTGLNHFLGVLTLEGVDGLSLDIEEVLGEHWGSVVNRNTGTVELTAKHLSGDGHAEHVTGELNVSLEIVDV